MPNTLCITDVPSIGKRAVLEADVAFIRTLYNEGTRYVHTEQLEKCRRQRLMQANYLIPALKRRWYLIHLESYRPFTEEDWLAVRDAFIAFYCETVLGAEWHLSQECSLLHHIGELAQEKAFVVHTPLASTHIRDLPYGCTLQTVKSLFPRTGKSLKTHNGMRVLTLPQSIIRVPPLWIQAHKEKYQKALSLVTDAHDFLEPLLHANRSLVAGRIASALRQVGRKQDAKIIGKAIRQADLRLRCTNPFSSSSVLPKTGVEDNENFSVQA